MKLTFFLLSERAISLKSDLDKTNTWIEIKEADEGFYKVTVSIETPNDALSLYHAGINFGTEIVVNNLKNNTNETK